MKSVTVRFFAVFRERTGQDVFQHVSAAESLRDLFREMSEEFPALKFESAALCAINDEMAVWEQGFEEGDEVLFFPPVAGG